MKCRAEGCRVEREYLPSTVRRLLANNADRPGRVTVDWETRREQRAQSYSPRRASQLTATRPGYGAFRFTSSRTFPGR